MSAEISEWRPDADWFPTPAPWGIEQAKLTARLQAVRDTEYIPPIVDSVGHRRFSGVYAELIGRAVGKVVRQPVTTRLLYGGDSNPHLRQRLQHNYVMGASGVALTRDRWTPPHNDAKPRQRVWFDDNLIPGGWEVPVLNGPRREIAVDSKRLQEIHPELLHHLGRLAEEVMGVSLRTTTQPPFSKNGENSQPNPEGSVTQDHIPDYVLGLFTNA